MEKYGIAGQATDENMAHAHFACLMTKATNTSSEYARLIALPLQHWLRERASMLRYTYSTVQYSTIQYSTVQYS